WLGAGAAAETDSPGPAADGRVVGRGLGRLVRPARPALRRVRPLRVRPQPDVLQRHLEIRRGGAAVDAGAAEGGGDPGTAPDPPDGTPRRGGRVGAARAV